MQNGAQIEPKTLKIHPLGNDFTPKMLPKWIQATHGAHGAYRSMPMSPRSPKRQPLWSQNSMPANKRVLACPESLQKHQPLTKTIKNINKFPIEFLMQFSLMLALVRQTFKTELKFELENRWVS